ncbi:MAG: hypothetical protein HLUCCA08_12265 [Rhodobacteraceae bacterium HLUCCA08]|nr:MAG: hypothetical protein HLUCCA08_12265 [Rhodobacteraceae bacterium HLUCCA08]
MTNRLALWLVLLIAAFFVLDHFVLQLDAALFLGRKFTDLIEYLAFWR